MTEDNVKITTRFIMIWLGALYAIALYNITLENFSFIQNPTASLILTMFWGVFGAAGLILIGPLGYKRAALVSLALAAVNAGLMLIARFRFEEIGPDLFVNTAWVWVATVLMPLPFIIGAFERPAKYLDYEFLYDTAWVIFIRYILGALCAGGGLLVIFLFAVALSIVGIDILLISLRDEFWLCTILGGLFGLSVAIFHETKWIISSVLYLAELLLRAFLPIVAVLSTLFVFGLILQGGFQGAGDTFLTGGSVTFSAGSILAAGVIFCTAVISSSTSRIVRNIYMIWAVRVMAVNGIILFIVIIWAIFLRVQQYGWTPSRLIICYLSVIAAVYAIGHFYAAIRPKFNVDVFRKTNILASVVAITGGVLWFTPVIDALSISAKSQEQRIISNKEGAAKALWEMQNEWGLAGKAAVARIKDIENKGDDLVKALSNFDARSKHDWRWNQHFERQVNTDKIKLVPENHPYKANLFDIDSSLNRAAARFCGDHKSKEHKCYAIPVELFSMFEGDEIYMFALRGHERKKPIKSAVLYRKSDRYWATAYNVVLERSEKNSVELFEKIVNGFEIADVSIQALTIDGQKYIVFPHDTEWFR